MEKKIDDGRGLGKRLGCPTLSHGVIDWNDLLGSPTVLPF
jgi:hypothetical protein